MYANFDARVAYLAHPRTASKATAAALEEQAGFEKVGGHHDGPVDFDERRERDAFTEEVDVAAAPNWTCFSAVRNHFAVLTSWDRHFEGRRVEWRRDWWESWVERRAGRFYVRNGRPDWSLFWHVPACDHVVRWRSLDLGVNAVLRSAGLPPVEVPGERPSRPSRSYRSRIPEDVREWAEERFGREMSRLGYGW